MVCTSKCDEHPQSIVQLCQCRCIRNNQDGFQFYLVSSELYLEKRSLTRPELLSIMDHYMSPRICLLIFQVYHLLDNLNLRLRSMSPPMSMPPMPILNISRVRPVVSMITMYIILVLMMAGAT
jgi:hypothetical protein